MEPGPQTVLLASEPIGFCTYIRAYLCITLHLAEPFSPCQERHSYPTLKLHSSLEPSSARFGMSVRFLEGGGLAWDVSHDGEEVARPNPPPPSATRRGPVVGEGRSSDSSAEMGTGPSTGALTGPAARRSSWMDGATRRREARREAEASEEWVNTTKADVAKLCEIAALPFWQVCMCLFNVQRVAFNLTC